MCNEIYFKGVIILAIPNLSSTDVTTFFPQCKVIGSSLHGGQKLVFHCLVDTKEYALKFMLINNSECDTSTISEDLSFDEVTMRAQREVNTLSECKSPYIIKLGPILLHSIKINNQDMLCFSEEWIKGSSLDQMLSAYTQLSIVQTLTLGIHMATAIKELWQYNKIHRDIKPANIMFSDESLNFVLLDMGLIFDLDDISLTRCGYIPGTQMYLTPDQLNYNKKRQLDFRSDLFALGVVMYECLTGKHPFYEYGMNQIELFDRIRTYTPPSILEFNSSVPESLVTIINRLLNKHASFRYRNCNILIADLHYILEKLEVVK